MSIPNTFLQACRDGNVQVVTKLLSNIDLSSVYIERGLEEACRNKHKDIVSIILTSLSACNLYNIDDVFVLSCSFGYLDIATCIYELGNQILNIRLAIIRASLNGHLNIIKWLAPKTRPCINQVFKIVCERGSCKIIQYFITHYLDDIIMDIQHGISITVHYSNKKACCLLMKKFPHLKINNPHNNIERYYLNVVYWLEQGIPRSSFVDVFDNPIWKKLDQDNHQIRQFCNPLEIKDLNHIIHTFLVL